MLEQWTAPGATASAGSSQTSRARTDTAPQYHDDPRPGARTRASQHTGRTVHLQASRDRSGAAGAAAGSELNKARLARWSELAGEDAAVMTARARERCTSSRNEAQARLAKWSELSGHRPACADIRDGAAAAAETEAAVPAAPAAADTASDGRSCAAALGIRQGCAGAAGVCEPAVAAAVVAASAELMAAALPEAAPEGSADLPPDSASGCHERRLSKGRTEHLQAAAHADATAVSAEVQQVSGNGARSGAHAAGRSGGSGESADEVIEQVSAGLQQLELTMEALLKGTMSTEQLHQVEQADSVAQELMLSEQGGCSSWPQLREALYYLLSERSVLEGARFEAAASLTDICERSPLPPRMAGSSRGTGSASVAVRGAASRAAASPLHRSCDHMETAEMIKSLSTTLLSSQRMERRRNAYEQLQASLMQRRSLYEKSINQFHPEAGPSLEQDSGCSARASDTRRRIYKSTLWDDESGLDAGADANTKAAAMAGRAADGTAGGAGGADAGRDGWSGQSMALKESIRRAINSSLPGLQAVMAGGDGTDHGQAVRADHVLLTDSLYEGAVQEAKVAATDIVHLNAVFSQPDNILECALRALASSVSCRTAAKAYKAPRADRAEASCDGMPEAAVSPFAHAGLNALARAGFTSITEAVVSGTAGAGGAAGAAGATAGRRDHASSWPPFGSWLPAGQGHGSVRLESENIHLLAMALCLKDLTSTEVRHYLPEVDSLPSAQVSGLTWSGRAVLSGSRNRRRSRTDDARSGRSASSAAASELSEARISSLRTELEQVLSMSTMGAQIRKMSTVLAHPVSKMALDNMIRLYFTLHRDQGLLYSEQYILSCEAGESERIQSLIFADTLHRSSGMVMASLGHKDSNLVVTLNTVSAVDATADYKSAADACLQQLLAEAAEDEDEDEEALTAAAGGERGAGPDGSAAQGSTERAGSACAGRDVTGSAGSDGGAAGTGTLDARAGLNKLRNSLKAATADGAPMRLPALADYRSRRGMNRIEAVLRSSERRDSDNAGETAAGAAAAAAAADAAGAAGGAAGAAGAEERPAPALKWLALCVHALTMRTLLKSSALASPDRLRLLRRYGQEDRLLCGALNIPWALAVHDMYCHLASETADHKAFKARDLDPVTMSHNGMLRRYHLPQLIVLLRCLDNLRHGHAFMFRCSCGHETYICDPFHNRLSGDQICPFCGSAISFAS